MSVHTYFEGNLSFYNEPKYREANRLVEKAKQLLMELGMTEEQAYDWIQGWCYSVEGD